MCFAGMQEEEMKRFDYIKKLYIQICCRIMWKKKNRHNSTRLGKNCDQNVFNLINENKLKVGMESYGTLNISLSNSSEEGLYIGSYCSISNSCTFLLGGEHNYKHFTSFPFLEKKNIKTTRKSKGKIIIHDDVWIGDHALILSGVEIGKGAVVGAGSVVTKNVPPYSIVVGNPAYVIKYRFSDYIISRLMDFSFNNLNWNLIDIEIDEINENNVDSILKYLNECCKIK